MQTKLVHMRRLLDQGYELWEVDSARGAVEATFKRGTEKVLVKFLPHEAEALLLAKGPLRLQR